MEIQSGSVPAPGGDPGGYCYDPRCYEWTGCLLIVRGFHEKTKRKDLPAIMAGRPFFINAPIHGMCEILIDPVGIFCCLQHPFAPGESVSHVWEN